MEAIGGLVGVTQDEQTLALRPKVGWAVREAERIDVLLARVTAEHTTFSGRTIEGATYLPEDLATFYHRTDGAELFGRGSDAACRILSVAEMESLDWGQIPEEFPQIRGPDGQIWHRFAWLANGDWLAINLDPNRENPLLPGAKRLDTRGFNPICCGKDDSQGRPGQNPVVALSFTELLERLLDQGRTPYWLDPQFIGYGDAEEYTRRG